MKFNYPRFSTDWNVSETLRATEIFLVASIELGDTSCIIVEIRYFADGIKARV
jgi:hypothetical protein